MQLVNSEKFSVSFELFPPRTPAAAVSLDQTLPALAAAGPGFVSVTYGASGSTRDASVDLAARLTREFGLKAVGHLTCVAATARELWETAKLYEAAGVSGFIAIRGDPPGGPGQAWHRTPGGFDHADQLVVMLSEFEGASVGVAAFPDRHPESSSASHDAGVLARKARLGAEFAVTQIFFDPRAYAQLVERMDKQACPIPIIPGIMPVTSFSQVSKFAALSGAKMPARLAARFERWEEDSEAVRKVGVEVAVELCEAVTALGAPGLHFYTLNTAQSTLEVHRALGLDAHGGCSQGGVGLAGP